MEVFTLKLNIFSLILTRMVALLSVVPVFSGQALNFFYRMSIAAATALILTPVAQFPEPVYDLAQTHYFTLLLEQAFIGVVIGLALQFLFAAFQMAGEFFSVQMGFGISEVFDPVSQISLPLLGTIKNLFAIYVFFVSGAHMYLFKALNYSIAKVPYLSVHFLTDANSHNGLYRFFMMLGSGMFLIALKIALPVMGTLLLISLTLGMLYKAAPQMNIMILGFPLKILVAFFVLAVTAPVIIELMFSQFSTLFDHLDELITTWPS